jgi:hypothetical protein
MTDDDQSHEGGCLCGDVRYVVSGKSVWSAICYCASCTRSVGGIAVAWAGIEKARFRIIKGELALYESTPGIWRGFCARCGTSLTYQKDPQVIPGAKDHVYVTTRSLDDPGAYPPEEHVFYGERMPWLEVPDDRPHHDSLSAQYAHLQFLTLTGQG